MPEQTSITINIPNHWKTPKYSLGQLVKHGQIIGIEYQPPGTRRAYDLGEGWYYSVLIDEQGHDVENLKESDIQPPSTEKIDAKIDELKALIEFHTSNAAFLSKQLEKVEKL